MSTYLQLVQQLYYELRLSGTVPSAVTSQSSQKREVTEFIAESAYMIESLHSDWDFMWTSYAGESTVSGTKDYSAQSDIGRYDLESFFLDYTSDSYTHLDYIPYKIWRRDYRNGTQDTDEPDSFVVKPDKSIVLYPTPDGAYTLTYDYWKAPTKMTADSDTSNVPVHFERVILELAKILYGQRYNDAAIIQTATPIYVGELKKLEADQLPDRQDSMGQAEYMTVITE